MTALRARISWIACAWLYCHLAVLAAAPLSLITQHSDAADPIACTCIHTGNARCPMHHPAKPAPNCQCRSTTDPGAASLVSMLGPTAVLATATTRLAPPSATKSPIHQIATFTSVITPPDGPPPRA